MPLVCYTFLFASALIQWLLARASTIAGKKHDVV